MPKINVDQLTALALEWVPRLLLFVVVIYVGFRLAARLVMIIEKRSRHKKMNETSLKFFLEIFHFFLKTLILVVGLGILNIPMASITAVIGAVTLSVGLALQGSLSNIAGGLVLVTFHPFQVGDYIQSDGFEGTVEEIGILATYLRTPDGKRVVLPNSLVSSKSLVNFSAFSYRRVEVVVLVDYKSDLEHVQDILTQLAKTVADARDITVPVSGNRDSGVELLLRVWVPKDRYLQTLYYLQSKIKSTLDQGKVEIPYPHMTLIMEREEHEL